MPRYDYACSRERFLSDVAEHKLSIDRDDGAHRHLRLRRPGTGVYWFDIITWPGTLCINGDGGTYVFSRLPDMFEFFRGPLERAIQINRSYWAEKCAAADREGIKKFDRDEFRANVVRWFRDHWQGRCDSAEDYAARRECWADLRHDVLLAADEGPHSAYAAARDFSSNGFRMADFWEVSSDRFTHGFEWCCWAIAWAVTQYDAAKAAQSQAA
jgi:hypothetical protein